LETIVKQKGEIVKRRKNLKILTRENTEQKEIIAKLKAQINRNYENSSNPSSRDPNHKKNSQQLLEN
jgi:hypothetical protein